MNWLYYFNVLNLKIRRCDIGCIVKLCIKIDKNRFLFIKIAFGIAQLMLVLS